MTKKEFLAKALLSIACSGVYGKPNFHYMEDWAEDVKTAAKALLDVAIKNNVVSDDEAEQEQPP